jgi:hypothetical protein
MIKKTAKQLNLGDIIYLPTSAPEICRFTIKGLRERENNVEIEIMSNSFPSDIIFSPNSTQSFSIKDCVYFTNLEDAENRLVDIINETIKKLNKEIENDQKECEYLQKYLKNKNNSDENDSSIESLCEKNCEIISKTYNIFKKNFS